MITLGSQFGMLLFAQGIRNLHIGANELVLARIAHLIDVPGDDAQFIICILLTGG